ncbi:hypothetical protein D3C85_1443590 [compost metagenome]
MRVWVLRLCATPSARILLILIPLTQRSESINSIVFHSDRLPSSEEVLLQIAETVCICFQPSDDRASFIFTARYIL